MRAAKLTSHSEDCAIRKWRQELPARCRHLVHLARHIGIDLRKWDRRSCALALLALAAGTMPAQAADFQQNAEPPDVPLSWVYSWRGFYPWAASAEYDYATTGIGFRTAVADDATSVAPAEVFQEARTPETEFNFRFAGEDARVPVMSYAPPIRSLADKDESFETIRVLLLADVGKDLAQGLVGGLFALSKYIDTSGPRLWATGGGGWYQFGAMNGTVRGVYTAGDVLFGYGFVGDSSEINLLAGLSAENDTLSQYDPTDPVVGTAFGPKVRGEAWINPTPQTLVYAEGEYTTVFRTYWTSAKYGVDVFGKQVFVGPEVTAFGDERSNQWRLGGHVTQLKLGKIEFDVSAGYAHDSLVGSGAYGHVEISTQF